jgi:hypothetical protein
MSQTTYSANFIKFFYPLLTEEGTILAPSWDSFTQHFNTDNSLSNEEKALFSSPATTPFASRQPFLIKQSFRLLVCQSYAAANSTSSSSTSELPPVDTAFTFGSGEVFTSRRTARYLPERRPGAQILHNVAPQRRPLNEDLLKTFNLRPIGQALKPTDPKHAFTRVVTKQDGSQLAICTTGRASRTNVQRDFTASNIVDVFSIKAEDFVTVLTKPTSLSPSVRALIKHIQTNEPKLHAALLAKDSALVARITTNRLKTMSDFSLRPVQLLGFFSVLAHATAYPTTLRSAIFNSSPSVLATFINYVRFNHPTVFEQYIAKYVITAPSE